MPLARSSQLVQLETEWPKTYASCRCTYFAGDGFGVTTVPGKNQAGYVLWGLRRYEGLARELHGQRELLRGALDSAASAELMYQWAKQRPFREAEKALVACWLNLVRERPEKIFAYQGRAVRCESSGVQPLSASLSPLRMVTPAIADRFSRKNA